MTPKALVLDFGGVVIKTPFEILAPLERRLALAPGTLVWFGPFAPERDELWRKMQRDELSERDYWALRAKEAGTASARSAAWQTVDLMHALFGGPEAEYVRPEAVEALAAAAEAGVPVAILTNDLAAFHGASWLGALSVSRSLKIVVDGSVTNVLKPDPAAYALVCEALGILPQEALFVDDQPRNVEGARRFGMPAMHFDVTQPAASFGRALAAFDMFGGRSTYRSRHNFGSQDRSRIL